MKIFFKLMILAICLSGCAYEDFTEDFDYTTAYFPIQNPVRTLILDEYNTIKVGATFGGRRTNDNNEWVTYEYDASLLEGKPFIPFPKNYCTFSNEEQIDILSGSFQGTVSVAFDLDWMAENTKPNAIFALPLRITGASLDSVHSEKDYTIIALKYIHSLDGLWYRKGKTSITDLSDNSTTELVYSETTLQKNIHWNLNTVGNNAVATDGMANTSRPIAIEMDENDNISISSTSDGVNNFTSTTAIFNKEDKEIYLGYSFELENKTYSSTDTLIFATRNIVFETW